MTIDQPVKFYLHHNLGEANRTITQQVGDELLVYDPLTHRAHNLNLTAARIYDACEKGKWEQQGLQDELGADVVHSILLELKKAGLIVWEPSAGVPRRRFLAAAAAPMICSVLIPVAAAAVSLSCIATGPSGCISALVPGSGGGSGSGPGGCVSCCGSGSFGSCPTCPDGCTTCFCMREFTCTNDGTTTIPCNTGTFGDICQSTTKDRSTGVTICTSEGTPIAGVKRSCAAARLAAGAGTGYVCCACP